MGVEWRKQQRVVVINNVCRWLIWLHCCISQCRYVGHVCSSKQRVQSLRRIWTSCLAVCCHFTLRQPTFETFSTTNVRSLTEKLWEFRTVHLLFKQPAVVFSFCLLPTIYFIPQTFLPKKHFILFIKSLSNLLLQISYTTKSIREKKRLPGKLGSNAW